MRFKQILHIQLNLFIYLFITSHNDKTEEVLKQV